MSREELRRLLVDAVPLPPVPDDRLALIAGLVRRRRTRRMTALAATFVIVTLATALPIARHRVDSRPATVPSTTAGVTPSPVTASVTPSPVTASVTPSPVTATTAAGTKSQQPSVIAPRPQGVRFDAGKIPPINPGSAIGHVKHTGEMPGPGGSNGWFRTVCQYSHMNADDPFAPEAEAGTSYLHVYWGNTTTAAGSTGQSLAAGGNSTCRGGTVDRSAYFTPAVIDTRTGAPVAPHQAHVYYFNGHDGLAPAQLSGLPKGLRMVTGDQAATARQNRIYWDCWESGGADGPTIPRTCPRGSAIRMAVTFPSCWDGRLDSPDHRAHMAWPVRANCPPSHPTPLPTVSFQVLYQVPPDGDTSRWRLATDTYPAAEPGGYGVTGGFIDGWRDDIKKTWTEGCVRKPVDCGSHMLGDGRVLGM